MANPMCEHRHLLFKDDNGGEIWTVTQSPDSPQVNKAFVQGLIDSGELMVVEYVTADKDGKCSKCGSYTDDGDLCDAPLLFVYCPGCGSKITR